MTKVGRGYPGRQHDYVESEKCRTSLWCGNQEDILDNDGVPVDVGGDEGESPQWVQFEWWGVCIEGVEDHVAEEEG